MKIKANEIELEKVKTIMINKLDRYYSGNSIMPETQQYERVRMLNNKDLEKEFKEVMIELYNKKGIKGEPMENLLNNYYFE